jgi:hypothetical protein
VMAAIARGTSTSSSSDSTCRRCAGST